MKPIKNLARKGVSLPRKALEALRKAWRQNPVRFVAGIVSVVVFVASKAGVVVPEQDLLHALAYVVPIIFGGEVARANVTPAIKE